MGKSLGAFATVAKTVQKSPSDTETELDASLRVRNMGLIDTGKAILNIGIAGATYAQRTEQLTPTISITTAASPIMKTIGSGYIAVGQDLEKSRVYFSEGMISSKDGQLKYNDPGLLTSVAFGLATAGVGGIVTKGIATTGGLALPRIFQAGGGKLLKHLSLLAVEDSLREGRHCRIIDRTGRNSSNEISISRGRDWRHDQNPL